MFISEFINMKENLRKPCLIWHKWPTCIYILHLPNVTNSIRTSLIYTQLESVMRDLQCSQLEFSGMWYFRLGLSLTTLMLLSFNIFCRHQTRGIRSTDKLIHLVNFLRWIETLQFTKLTMIPYLLVLLCDLAGYLTAVTAIEVPFLPFSFCILGFIVCI